MPPVTTSSWSPARIIWSAISTARIDDAQTLLIVSAPTSIGIPAPIAAWRAGAWPAPAWRTWPMITYSTPDGSSPARSSAARMTIEPSSVAALSASEPPSFPKGVRTAETMTERLIQASLAEGFYPRAHAPASAPRQRDHARGHALLRGAYAAPASLCGHSRALEDGRRGAHRRVRRGHARRLHPGRDARRPDRPEARRSRRSGAPQRHEPRVRLRALDRGPRRRALLPGLRRRVHLDRRARVARVEGAARA